MLKSKLFSQKGGSSVEGLVLVTVVVFSILIAGGLFFTNVYMKAVPVVAGGICCDNADCSPITTKNITFTSPTSLTYPQYKNVPIQYDLLKSNTTIYECNKHGVDSKQTALYPDGIHPIIYSTSQELAGTSGECHTSGFDQLAEWINGVKTCVPIPDDELVYVCIKNCEPPYGTAKRDNSCDPSAPVYGNSTTVYDIYFRHADYPIPGVSSAITNCQAGNADPNYTPIPTPTPTPVGYIPGGNEQNAILQITPYPSHETLQLHTFDFTQQGGAVAFPRGYCKPALYLYPQRTEPVTVKINPQGRLNVTIPTYPTNGWNVTVDPKGTISYQNHFYDYLYYSAAIPDQLIPPLDTGYVVSYDKLTDFFPTLLTKLGLNAKEQNQFIDYWMKALPYAAYYKINIVPMDVLDNISPLTITPKPDTLLRVTLNFQPLDKPIAIVAPTLPSVQRVGFTVVEWAGLYKQDKNHPFTCLE